MDMRTLDDFVFVKDAGFGNVYDSINETLSLYDRVPLRIYCSDFRNPLDYAIYSVFDLANIKDAIVPKGLSGDNIGRLKQVMPEDVFIKTGGLELLTELNTTCSPYHHRAGWPPEVEWNKDAEKCYKLMVEICHWLVLYKKDIAKYIKENGPIQWREIREKKIESFKALPENNTVSHTFQTGFEEMFLAELDKTEDYKKSLAADLEFYYNKMYEASSVFEKKLHDEFDSLELPEEASNAINTMHETCKILPMVSATTQVLFYDSVVHPILFSHDWSPEKLQQLSVIEKIPADYIYKGLLCINTYAVCKVIGTLSCSQSQIESLQNAFRNQNENSFKNALNKLTCDLTALHILASVVPYIIKRDYGMMLKPEATYEWAISSGTGFTDTMFKNNGVRPFDDSVFENLPPEERLEKGLAIMTSSAEIMKNQMVSTLLGFSQMEEMEEWPTLFPFEKSYVNQVLENEDVKKFLANIDVEPITEDNATDTAPGVSDVQIGGDFEFPEDFFTSKYPRDAKNTDKHFNVDYDVEKYGGRKFAQLINTITSWGLVSSSDTQKLVYILSGRLKPNNFDSDGIEWIDSGYGYELLYIIKYIIGNEKGKYEKARRLFHGPQWLGKGDFKDQADYADAGFRRALNDIYPDVCIIKGHVETVR